MKNFISKDFLNEEMLDCAAFVSKLYHVILRRIPDNSGRQSWVKSLENGLDPIEALFRFADSKERFSRRDKIFALARELSIVTEEGICSHPKWPAIALAYDQPVEAYSKIRASEALDATARPGLRLSSDGTTLISFVSLDDTYILFEVFTFSEVTPAAVCATLQGRAVVQTLSFPSVWKEGEPVASDLVDLRVDGDQLSTVELSVQYEGRQPAVFALDAAELGRLRDELQQLSRQQPVDVSLVGRFGASLGIALHTKAFLDCLRSTDLRIGAVDTRPNESRWAELQPSLRARVVRVQAETSPLARTAIYCDVVANSQNDWNVASTPPAVLKYILVQFDSTKIPNYWLERIDKFDGVLVVHECMAETLRNSGVTRPVFVLPLAIDFQEKLGEVEASEAGSDDFDDREEAPFPKTSASPFTFGCIAGFGERKNLKSLIDAFIAAFGNNAGVQLHIHSSLAFGDAYIELLDHVKSTGAKNITASNHNLTPAQYGRLFKGFDAYVQVSKGEGWSITAREAFYLGIPTILSDNSAHTDLVATGLCYGVPTARVEPAFYEAHENLYCGVQSIPDPDFIKAGFLDVIANRQKYLSVSHLQTKYACQFTPRSLHEKYRTAVAPKNIFLGNENLITNNHIVTTDRNFYDRAQAVRRMRKNAVPKAQRQRLVVMGHDGGFFSVFNTFLSHLVWNVGRDEVQCVLPDWRINSIQAYRKTEKFTSFCYGKRSDGNLWLKFFEPLPEMDVSESQYHDDQTMSDNVIILENFNEINEPLLTYIHAYKLYKKEDFAEWRHWYHRFYRQYIHVRERLSAEVETIVRNHFSSRFVVAAHVRHPSHAIEQPGASIPTVDLYIRKILERVAGIPNYAVFLATDQQSVVDRFAEVFGSRLIFRTEVSRVSLQHDNQFKSLTQADQMKEGHQIQHLVASQEGSWNSRMADEVIVDTLLLARADCFIHVTSNIATAVSFINPDIEMIYCE